jgi:predicted esterase
MMRFVAGSLLALVLASTAVGQFDRHELGRRLREFEIVYEAETDSAARKRATDPLTRAVNAFFTSVLRGGFAETARGLDEARFALLSDKPPEDAIRWAESLALQLDRRFLDLTQDSVGIRLDAYYNAKAEKPKRIALRLSLVPEGKKEAKPVATFALDKLPLEEKLPLTGLREGDFELRAEIIQDDRSLARIRQSISLAERVKERMGKLATKQENTMKPTTDRLSAEHLGTILNSLLEGKTLETDYPAARLLGEAEALTTSMSGKRSFHGPGHTGQFWLMLATEGSSAPVRVQVPDKVRDGKPIPLVLALHGAGGSENMFFDAYGNGKAARLCAERGWLLVTTRNGLAAGVFEEICRLYPVDRSRVYLVGHSMGAANSLAAINRNPERFAAVAALGGSGRVVKSDALKDVACFVGCGSADFAMRGARGLHDNLKEAGVKKLVFKEYKDTEHLAVVQLALDDVFKFFDESARK